MLNPKDGKRAALAQQTFAYRVIKYVGAYAAAMNGVDVICFTAGLGENDSKIRKMIMKNLTYLGVQLNDEVNDATHGKEAIISTADSKVTCIAIPTNEELAICRETVALV